MSVLALLHLQPDRRQKRLQMRAQIQVCDAQVPIQQEQQLFLHQVDLRQREAESVVPAHGRIPRPMFVLRRRVVEVLGGQDEGGEEDAVHGAAHPLGDGG